MSSCKIISKNYIATSDDYYIGVNSKKAVTVTLPSDPLEFQQIIIKVETARPLGHRTVTVVAKAPSSIDGEELYKLMVAYKSVSLIYHDGHWYSI